MNNNFEYKNITIGSDPEFFIVNKKGKLISSIGLINGTKYEPQVLKILGDGFAIQTDNVLGEFNIPVSYTPHEAMNNIAIMKGYIAGFLANKDLQPKYMASGVYGKDQLDSAEAKMFGCSVDYNAWEECANERPKGESTRLRSAGCHIHVGYDNPDEESGLNLIKALDLFLGIPSVIIDPDNERRQLYGKAGCFRFTGFGIEYRVLSGYFISDNKLTEWCFNQVFEAIKFLNQNNGINILFLNENKDLIQNIINTGSKEAAIDLIKELNINIKY